MPETETYRVLFQSECRCGEPVTLPMDVPVTVPTPQENWMRCTGCSKINRLEPSEP